MPSCLIQRSHQRLCPWSTSVPQNPVVRGSRGASRQRSILSYAAISLREDVAPTLMWQS